MNEGLIPRRYAKALYKYAQEKGCAKEVYADTQVLEKAFASHPSLSKSLGNPALSSAEKVQLLTSAVGENADKGILRFFHLVTLNRRETYLRAMALSYQDIYRQENGISRVTIVSAAKLDEAIVNRIKKLLMSRSEKKLEFVYETDSSLIGGFILRVESMQLDASIQNELKQMRVKLLNK